MYRFMSDAIASISTFFSSLRLKQAIVAGLVSVLMLTSTACGSSPKVSSSRSYDAAPSTYNANERPSKGNSPYDKGTSPQRELYRSTQSQKGGMNNYSDDAAYDQGDTNAAAQKLIKQAENRLQKRAESPQELIDNTRERNPLGEGVQDLSNRIGNSTEQAKENIQEGFQKGTKNLKANLSQAREEAPNVVEKAGENVRSATRDVQAGAKDLSDSAQRMIDRADSNS